MDLSGKWALVTGAGRGIGKGCALQLAGRGADLVLNDRPGSPDLANTVEEIEAMGRQCVGIEADVFERDGCEQLVSSAVDGAGQLDILVSNPAYSERCSFLEYPPELFEQTLRGTLLAGFHISQLTARHMVELGGGGKIVFISTSVGFGITPEESFAIGVHTYSTPHNGRTTQNDPDPQRSMEREIIGKAASMTR